MPFSDVPMKHTRVTVDLCRLAYDYSSSTEKVKHEICELLKIKPESIHWFDIQESDTQALIVIENDTLYLSFPGTVGDKDIATDLDFELEAFLGGHCHGSFLSVANNTFGQIGAAIKSKLIENPKLEIVITGHSLGGALAMMYATLFRKENPDFPIEYLITYGQPRCGNKGFSTSFGLYGLKYFRFLNRGDIVPDVPPPWGKSNWSHAGRGLIFDNGEIRDTMDSDETAIWNRALNLILPIAFRFFRKETNLTKELIETSKAFHSMNLYKANIFKHFPEA